MVLRLSRSFGQERLLELGYGLAVMVRPFTFAEYKEAEAAAMRLARETLPPASAFEVEVTDDEDLPPEVEDATRGQYAAHLVRILLRRFGLGWIGLETEEGGPAPFERESIDQVLAQFPGVARILEAQLLAPVQEIAAEGKPSAPSPSTD